MIPVPFEFLRISVVRNFLGPSTGITPSLHIGAEVEVYPARQIVGLAVEKHSKSKPGMKTDRYDRSRRVFAVCVTIIVGLIAAAMVAGMIYVYYQTGRFRP